MFFAFRHYTIILFYDSALIKGEIESLSSSAIITGI
jgi:hypothetical protein